MRQYYCYCRWLNAVVSQRDALFAPNTRRVVLPRATRLRCLVSTVGVCQVSRAGQDPQTGSTLPESQMASQPGRLVQLAALRS